MRFQAKALTILVVAGVTPVVLLGALSYRANREELASVVGSAQLRAAAEDAAQAEEAVVGVAEDEAALRTALAHSLAGIGFEVLQGDSAEAALAVARSHGGRIDLLLTDVIMPGQSGAQLAAALRRERPEVKVLYMTGFPGDPRVGEVMGSAGAEVIHKPFKHSTLVEQVRRLVSEP